MARARPRSGRCRRRGLPSRLPEAVFFCVWQNLLVMSRILTLSLLLPRQSPRGTQVAGTRWRSQHHVLTVPAAASHLSLLSRLFCPKYIARTKDSPRLLRLPVSGATVWFITLVRLSSRTLRRGGPFASGSSDFTGCPRRTRLRPSSEPPSSLS